MYAEQKMKRRTKKYRFRHNLAAKRIQRAFRRTGHRRGRFTNVPNTLDKMLKSIHSMEEHRWQDDINFTMSIPGAGGDIFPIGLEFINQGDNINQRTGNKITLSSLYLKGQMIVADSHNFVRILLVMVNSLNQIIIPSDILQPDTTTTNPTIYSPFRKESKIKFRVLIDKMYKLQQQAAGSVYPEIVNVDLSYNFKTKKDPNGCTITYNQQGNSTPIYWYPLVIAISDSQITTHPAFRGSKRLTWLA